MASPPGGTPVETSIVQRVSGALRYVFTGNPGWFGPGERLPEQAPDEEKGRAFDYPFGANTTTRPKTEASQFQGMDFATLRRVADPVQGGLDLLRLAIETRKDQLAACPWKIGGRGDKVDDGGKPARDLEEALRLPDGVRSFRQWQRELVEDLLVIDAPTVYLRPKPGGGCYPEVVDGATIKRLLSETGRTPFPPNPAYQQYLKGVPATKYTIDELIYAPRNTLSFRIYGMSPTEQVVGIIGIALNRQLSVSSFYTEGTLVDMILNAPEHWTPDQIKDAQLWLDSMLEGEERIGKRRKMRVFPGLKPFQPKEAILKDEFDEWIARVICYAFSLSPQAFVKQVNRASAQTMKQIAQSEGLEPMKLWFKDIMDLILVKGYGVKDLEFRYVDEEITDAETKAKVAQILITAGVVKAGYIAENWYGLNAIPENELPTPAAAQAGKQPGGTPVTGPASPSSEAALDGAAAAEKMAKIAGIAIAVTDALEKKSRSGPSTVTAAPSNGQNAPSRAA